MLDESTYLAHKVARETTRVCGMQIVFADIVAYSQRKTHQQIQTILAFTSCFKDALHATASAYTDEMAERGTHLQRDIVIVPTGDGVALGFPFDLPGISLDFVDHLVTTVNAHNSAAEVCARFEIEGFCDCHDKFRLRIGISEGQTVLYRDLNEKINIAGNDVNLAARVMGLADPGQVLLTDRVHQTITQLVRGRDGQFRTYFAARVKHDVHLDVHQYINPALVGLAVDLTHGLGPAGPSAHARPTADLVTDDHGPTSRSRCGTASNTRSAAPIPGVGKPLLPMVQINGERFMMGTKTSGRVDVHFSRPFLISTRLVTQSDYEAIVGNNPSQFIAPTNPVERVSWYDAVRFCNALSAAEGHQNAYEIAGQLVTITQGSDGYRLPTEAEWEFCCRGDAGEDRYGPIEEIAWYSANANGESRPVDELRPNRGIHDLLGNVWEWCCDWYQREHPDEVEADYAGPTSGYQRVIRGGSWRDQASSVTADFRGRESPSKCDGTIGFRIVRDLPF